MKNSMRFLAVLMISLAALSCGSEREEDSMTNVRISIGSGYIVSASSTTPPESIKKIRIVLSAPDIIETVRLLDVEGTGQISESFDVPNGLSRHFSVEAFDAYGNVLYTGEAYADLFGKPVALSIALSPTDTISPSVPLSFTITNASFTQIDLTWAASSDNVRVTGYKIYRDGLYLTAVASTSFSDKGLSPSTDYCYQAASYDGNGNVSVKSEEKCAGTPSMMKVAAWGDNYKGQLGDGSYVERNIPVYAAGIINAVKISGGGNHSLAVMLDGTVTAWGYNAFGQLGDGTTTDSLTPVQSANLSNVKEVSAGANHSLALKEDGTVWAWGYNAYGQLGDGTTTYKLTPVPVSSITNAVAISAGANHSVALLSNGTVMSWGYNSGGQLGDGTDADRTSPVIVNGISNAVDVAAGEHHSIAVVESGVLINVWAWGNNSYGQLGNNTATSSSIPVQTSKLEKIEEVEAGSCHSLALKGGSIFSWGCNYQGQLGNGTTENRAGNTNNDFLQSLNSIMKIKGGFNHSIALRADGTVWAWGESYYGQLGDGTPLYSYSNKTSPVKTSISDVIEIDAGSNHNLAVVLIDKRKPSVPAGLSVAQGSSGKDLSWAASSDDIKVKGYKIYNLDNNYAASIASVTDATNYTDTAARTAYCYKVSAYDLRGNESDLSEKKCYP